MFAGAAFMGDSRVVMAFWTNKLYVNHRTEQCGNRTCSVGERLGPRGGAAAVGGGVRGTSHVQGGAGCAAAVGIRFLS